MSRLGSRVKKLERDAQDKGASALEERLDEEIEERRARATPEARARFDAAEERARLVMEAEGAYSESDEMGAALDAYLDALADLTASAREFTEPQKRAERGNLHGWVR